MAQCAHDVKQTVKVESLNGTIEKSDVTVIFTMIAPQ